MALALLGASSSATARTVEFLDDMAAIRAAADDQGITGPFSEEPGPGGRSINLETPDAADHRVMIASVYCQAYRVENPVSVLLLGLVKKANGDRAAAADTIDASPLTLRILSGSTVLRCLGKNDFEATCKNRVRLTAEVSFQRPDGSIGKAPIAAQIERDGRVGGACGNMARYTGIVTREAGIELLRQARQAAGA